MKAPGFPPWMEKWTSQYNFEMAQPMKHYSQVVFQLEFKKNI
jgi:hypothetical protein